MQLLLQGAIQALVCSSKSHKALKSESAFLSYLMAKTGRNVKPSITFIYCLIQIGKHNKIGSIWLWAISQILLKDYVTIMLYYLSEIKSLNTPGPKEFEKHIVDQIFICKEYFLEKLYTNMKKACLIMSCISTAY